MREGVLNAENGDHAHSGVNVAWEALTLDGVALSKCRPADTVTGAVFLEDLKKTVRGLEDLVMSEERLRWADDLLAQMRQMETIDEALARGVNLSGPNVVARPLSFPLGESRPE